MRPTLFAMALEELHLALDNFSTSFDALHSSLCRLCESSAGLGFVSAIAVHCCCVLTSYHLPSAHLPPDLCMKLSQSTAVLWSAGMSSSS